MADFELPQDVLLEQAMLGSMLVNNSLIDRAAAELDRLDLFDPLHQRIFETMVALHAEGAVTPLVLHSVMQYDPGLREVGGISYLVTLATAAPALPAIETFSRVLKDLASRRRLAQIGEDLVAQACDLSGTVGSVSSRAMDGILAASGAVRKANVRASDVALQAVQIADDRLHGRHPASIRTGIRRLDEKLGGLQATDLCIVAGRSGMGKTALLGSVCWRAALYGHPVLWFSREMPALQVTQRILCDIALSQDPAKPLHFWKFRSGSFSNLEIERLFEAQVEFAKTQELFEICDEQGTSFSAVAARARAFIAKHPNQLCLIAGDYLQIFDPPEGSRDRSREQEVSAVANGFKALANDTGSAACVAAQLKNKGTDQERMPTAEDIRESGSIEMAADIIIAPWRKAFFIRQREPEEKGSPAHEAWRGEMTEYEHKMRMLGFKFRHGDAGTLNLDLWCDMGCSAIRDEKPSGLSESLQDENAKGLLV